MNIIKPNPKKYKIPFDEKGNLHTFADWRITDWRENYVFEDRLKIVGYGRGRSAANFHLKSMTNGIEYGMFLKETLIVLERCVIDRGEFDGVFTFKKAGSNYSVGLYLD